MSKRKRIPYGLAVTTLALHSTLTAHQKLVLIAITEHFGINDSAWPSYTTLARLTSLTRRTVIKTVKALTGAGILTISYPPGQRSNRYTPDFQELMNRVGDQQVKERIKERLAQPDGPGGEEGSPLTEPGREAIVKGLHQGSETSSPDDEPLSPAGVKAVHQGGEPPSPERPREACPPKPKVKRPRERSLRLPPQPERGGLLAGEGGMTHRLPGSVLDDREYLSDYIKSSTFSELVREVEIRLNNPVEDGNPFCFKNQVPVTLLAARLVSLLANLDATPHHDDLLNAINDEEFSGLKRLSWGLLLSDRFRPRFKWLIKKYQDRRLNPHGPDPSLRAWSSNGVAHSGHRLLLDPMDG